MSESSVDTNRLIGGKYRIERPIGSGGFSEVYLATHMAMDRPVALKIFDPKSERETNPSRANRRQERFEQEARLVSQLNHPNTVTIFDFGVHEDGKLYLVMEFIKGKTFQEILRKEAPLNEERALQIILQLLKGLESAHHLDILHRDLKPANIMLARNFKGEEVVKVLDFGIAQMLSAPHQETSDDGRPIFLGTPRYAAPEQLLAGKLSYATDIYAVGVLLWEALLGTRMISAKSLGEYVNLAASRRPILVPRNTDLREELRKILEKAISKEPSQRYANAAEMIAAIESASQSGSKDLPRLERSPFSPNPDIVDPNLMEHDEVEAHYLLTTPPRPGRELRASPGRGLPRREVRNLREEAQVQEESLASPISESLDGSEPSALQRRRATKRSSSEQRASSSTSTKGEPAEKPRRPAVSRSGSRHVERKENSFFWTTKKSLSLGVLSILLGVGLLVFVLSTRDSSPAIEESNQEMGTTVLEPETPPRPALSSPFSVAGISAAMVATGQWRVTDRRGPVDMRRFQFYSLVLSKRGATLDVTIYELATRETEREIIENIRFPSEYISIGHFVVRLTPRDETSNEEARELLEDLLIYRALVLEEVNR